MLELALEDGRILSLCLGESMHLLLEACHVVLELSNLLQQDVGALLGHSLVLVQKGYFGLQSGSL